MTAPSINFAKWDRYRGLAAEHRRTAAAKPATSGVPPATIRRQLREAGGLVYGDPQRPLFPTE